MEDDKDFLSLKLMTSVVEDNTDSVYMRGSGMQWPFSSKVSAFMPVSTADAFDANKKTLSGVLQPKNFSIERQGGNNYGLVQQADAQWTHRALESGTFYANNPFLKALVAPSRHNFTPTIRQQPLGGTPVTTHHSYVPSSGAMAAVVDQRNVSKPTGTSAQLTIFYGGSVRVYDDVSPDKAQSIMNMAGNGSSMSANMTSPKSQVQASNSSPLGGDVSQGNQSVLTSPGSALSSPASITSQANAQPASGSRSIAATLMSSDVPQARKASLARFLEKRKERALNAAPYNGNPVPQSAPAKKEMPW